MKLRDRFEHEAAEHVSEARTVTRRSVPRATYACLSCMVPMSMPERHRGHRVVRK